MGDGEPPGSSELVVEYRNEREIVLRSNLTLRRIAAARSLDAMRSEFSFITAQYLPAPNGQKHLVDVVVLRAEKKCALLKLRRATRPTARAAQYDALGLPWRHFTASDSPAEVISWLQALIQA